MQDFCTTAAFVACRSGSLALEPESFTPSLDRDDLSSAQTLYKAGRGSYDRGEYKTAKLYFGLAERLFTKADEVSSAYIARDWYNSLSGRE